MSIYKKICSKLRFSVEKKKSLSFSFSRFKTKTLTETPKIKNKDVFKQKIKNILFKANFNIYIYICTQKWRLTYMYMTKREGKQRESKATQLPRHCTRTSAALLQRHIRVSPVKKHLECGVVWQMYGQNRTLSC
jgi:hypothetical protein